MSKSGKHTKGHKVSAETLQWVREERHVLLHERLGALMDRLQEIDLLVAKVPAERSIMLMVVTENTLAGLTAMVGALGALASPINQTPEPAGQPALEKQETPAAATVPAAQPE